MMKLVYILGHLNCFLVTFLSWVFFFIPHWFAGTFEKVSLSKRLGIIWDVANDTKFFKESMDGWYGFVLGGNICVVDVPDREHEWWFEHLEHEDGGHIIQNYWLGVLFIPVYTVCTLWLYLFCHSKHSYHDNPFERRARRVAGQKVDLTPEEWTDGRNDRFPWA